MQEISVITAKELLPMMGQPVHGIVRKDSLALRRIVMIAMSLKRCFGEAMLKHARNVSIGFIHQTIERAFYVQSSRVGTRRKKNV